MERRTENRKARRVQVQFWPHGSESRHVGFSTNISSTGMFIATNSPLPKGSRLRIEVIAGQKGFVIEGVVARLTRSSPALQRIRQRGMGVHFLTVEQLVAELFPESASRQSSSSADHLPKGTYALRFPTRRDFLAAYRRDIVTGGLFVPTDELSTLNEEITILLEVGDSQLQPLEVRARVVHCMEPDTAGGSNLIAGIGVELVDPESTTEKIRSWSGMFRDGG